MVDVPKPIVEVGGAGDFPGNSYHDNKITGFDPVPYVIVGAKMEWDYHDLDADTFIDGVGPAT